MKESNPSPEQHLQRPPRPVSWSLECPQYNPTKNYHWQQPPSLEKLREVVGWSCKASSNNHLSSLRPVDPSHHRPRHNLHGILFTVANKPKLRDTAGRALSRRETTQKMPIGAAKQKSVEQAAIFLTSVQPTQAVSAHANASTWSTPSPDTISGQVVQVYTSIVSRNK